MSCICVYEAAIHLAVNKMFMYIYDNSACIL